MNPLFPRGSKDFFEMNPHLSLDPQQLMTPKELKEYDKHRIAAGWKDPNKRALSTGKQPNKTEAEFGRILESQKQRGEILRYVYEGITFRWLDMRYTPDWMVVYLHADNIFCGFKAIEVKGPHIFDRDIVRFKGARALWPEITFEMWQKKAGQWAQIF